MASRGDSLGNLMAQNNWQILRGGRGRALDCKVEPPRPNDKFFKILKSKPTKQPHNPPPKPKQTIISQPSLGIKSPHQNNRAI